MMEQSDRVEKKVVNNFFGNINNFFAAPVTYNAPVTNIANDERKSEAQDGYSDEQVAAALTRIVGKGRPIDSKMKWAGALWLLRWECNYPAKAKEFCERISQLPLPEDLEYKCEYRNIREVATLSFMNEDPRQLDKVRYSKNDEQIFFLMKEVAVALDKELHQI